LEDQQSPTKGGPDRTIHRHGCARRKLKDFPVETNGQSLVEAIRMIPGHKHLVFDEGLQSAWLFETLKPHVDDIIVAGITTSRGPKSDKGDAYALAENLDTLPVEGCNVGALEVRGLGPARGMERERDSALGQAPEFVAHPRVPPRSRSFDPGISPDASG
jgi:hypothetical protein